IKKIGDACKGIDTKSCPVPKRGLEENKIDQNRNGNYPGKGQNIRQVVIHLKSKQSAMVIRSAF
ncbi:MAG: hypothetical protein OQK35_08415, partial [Alphaproteobacteria bacterium]|nr:hypothetical protein [Alphaproteobacteria bacterium]